MENKVKHYPSARVSNARNYEGEKRTVNRLRFVSAGKMETVVDARWWMGRSTSASVVYCSVWVSPPVTSEYPAVSGRGTAGGSGYHKESAALEDAFTSAGVTFEQYFGGCGDSAMQKAIEAAAAFLGVEGRVI
jgi:hypothetical protein